MQPIDQPRSLTEITAIRIRDAIVSGELALGVKLSEQRLSESLGVSRSPVRDALATLQSEGLVNISPKRGSFVFTPDLHIVEELCEHRAILEAAAVRMGIARNHAALTEQIEHAISAMQTAIDAGDGLRYTIGDLWFHEAIVDSCANHSVIRAYSQTISPLKALRTHLFTILNERPNTSMGEHLAIRDVCRDGDADTAATLLGEHAAHLAKDFRGAFAGIASEYENRCVS